MPEQLLPNRAFKLISVLDPDRVEGSRRAQTLSQILSLELAVDDPRRRKILLNAVPSNKVGELEDRVGMRIDLLKDTSHLGKPLRRTLLGFFGRTTSVGSAGISIDELSVVKPAYGLFPHQKRAAMAVERYLYHEDGRVMLHLPTGVGKTRTAMSIVTTHLRNHESGVVLWLAATRELLEQAAVEFESTWMATGDRPVDCLRFWSDYNPPIESLSKGIVVSGLAKLRSYGRNRTRLWDLGDRTTMVVFDEAHQAVATTYEDLVKTIVTRRPRTTLLGLSATPGRTWDNHELDATVASLFFGNKVIIDFGGVNPIQRLTEEGYLATVNFSRLDVESGVKLSSSDLAQISQALDISDELVARFGEDEQRNLRIVQRLIELADSHSRILVFACSVNSALLLASICRGVGLQADAVTGNTETEERHRLIDQFKRRGGPSRVLINYGVLTTGFDAPRASAALISRPTKSLVLYSQMVGRVIRGPRAGGTECCEVVTVVDTTLPGFRDVTEAFMNWEDVWNEE